MITLPKPLRVVYISTYPPRRCGIATYTKDLANGINNLNPECFAEIIAMDDAISEELSYPWEVSRRIRQDVWDDYATALDYLNSSVVDVVCLQHEYGIYGADSGAKVVDFVRELKKPLVVTFHSVLQHPTEDQKKILQAIATRAEKNIVMLEASREVLATVYGVPLDKIVAIHHGAPDFALESSDSAKKKLRLSDRIVMSNINLLGRGRGIEYAIEALPEVVEKYPNFLYLIVGQTHPSVLRHEGEKYRRELESLVKSHGLEKNVRFINKYVSLEDLILYVRASDFYITPYENMETASSGSLAYAIAAGKLCIATPFKYALEMFAGGRGMLVPPGNPKAITKALLEALAHPDASERIRMKCYQVGRKMTWNRVGYRYFEVFQQVLGRGSDIKVGQPKLDYLVQLSDSRGILEHSSEEEKNLKEGYAVDDNARALIVAIQNNRRDLARVYMKFLADAVNGDALFCDYDVELGWQGTASYGDWFGRAIWALAYCVRYALTVPMRREAERLLATLLPGARNVTHLRTAAYICLGLVELKQADWPELEGLRQEILEHILSLITSHFKKSRRLGWQWVEKIVSYDNARIPQALISVGRVFNRPELIVDGRAMLEFLLDVTYDDRLNHFRFVGNKGWYERGKKRAVFDEQAIDAGAMVMACMEAYYATGWAFYHEIAGKALSWFLGENIHRRPLYQSAKGSVYDGITPTGLNLNQGAESLLEYLLGYACYAKLEQEGLQRDSINTLTTV